ncbi:hypothetical protein GUITHDRAFT_108515 [Guillardia theta CCMP2712]|uniref:CDT1 Geminin-binding domain-containing protein n=2 Tax=Guillardia theta TaxID=55529 RepID=L1JAR8_GUITC|nr:hypothetical protein GUITHDRAFT_108515 [Guillardia theta CCMP2712]EKX45638.1 hypothetical protein GUITHDRAFT_108515 [Guillardia theta CCMP2712]|eukprot:XP_005832618.1 hypothetical protein GUITHDRAFT_108515 [Guillardia theta CCMP2712]
MTKRGRIHEQNQRLLIEDWRQVRGNDRPLKKFAAQKKKSEKTWETSKEQTEEQPVPSLVSLEEQTTSTSHEDVQKLPPGQQEAIPPSLDPHQCELAKDPPGTPTEASPAEVELPKVEATMKASPKNRGLAIVDHALHIRKEKLEMVEETRPGGAEESVMEEAREFLQSERKMTIAERARANTRELMAIQRRKARTISKSMARVPDRSSQMIHRRQILPAEDLLALVPAVVEQEREIQLPQSFNRLIQHFDCLDTSLSFAKSRRPTEVCTFTQLQRNVQDISKRDFPLRSLQQIVSAFPAAYRLGWIAKDGRFQLTVDFPSEGPGSSRPSPSLLLERKRQLRKKMLVRVKEQHDLFLEGKGLQKVKEEMAREWEEHEDEDDLVWHKDFSVEKIQDIPPAPLPLKPNEVEEIKLEEGKNEALKETLSKSSGAVRQALLAVLNQREGKESHGGTGEEAKEAMEEEAKKEVLAKPVPKSLSGLSPALIEKIRLKELKKAQEAKKDEASPHKRRDEASQEAPARSDKAPTGRVNTANALLLAEMVHAHFRLRGACRNAMPLRELAVKMLGQHRDSSMTRFEGQVEEQLEFIARVAPSWCSMREDPLNKEKIFLWQPGASITVVRAAVKEHK